MKKYCFFFVLYLMVSLLLLGCGTSSKSPSAGTTPPTTGGTPPSGSGSSSVQYQSPVTDSSAGGITGVITVDTAGKGALDMMTKVPNAHVDLAFSPFSNGTTGSTVASFNGDASGEVKGAFTMPTGTYSGIFVFTLNGTNVFTDGFSIPNGTTPFLAQLVPAAQTTNKLGQEGTLLGIGNDPGSGSVTVAAGSSIAHIQIQGAVANATDGVEICRNGGGSSCFAPGTFNTNSTGSGTADVSVLGTEGGVFLVGRQLSATSAPIDYAGGFKVP
jgi:hypothetical protein